MSLKEKAKEVLDIIANGGYTASDGNWIDIRDQINYSVKNSKTYTPSQLAELGFSKANESVHPEVVVTEETTQIAASRLFKEGYENLVLLNFASARNPGGGFLNGAKAQEEDLSRCSALYQCLISQQQYYEANRTQDSMLYTDHIIYSPRVPWFRTRSRDEPNELYTASVVTAPAPNAGQALRRGETIESVQSALLQRCGKVLAVARDNGHKNLILGAWGCGVFGNDPTTVAASFQYWLKSQEFTSAFDNVVFAVYDRSREKDTIKAFQGVFSSASGQ